MVRVKVRNDKYGPCVKAGGYVFRPVFPLHCQHSHKDGTEFHPGEAVKAYHHGGSQFATVRGYEDHEELWFSHGCYLDSRESSRTEDHYKPRYHEWEERGAA